MKNAWLKERLDEIGKTQTEVGATLGLHQTRISEIIQGRRQVKASELAPLAQALNWPVSRVLDMLQIDSSNIDDYETILFERLGSVARITINRPDAANALNTQLGRDLMEAAIACSEDPSVRAVILTAAGEKLFCAGGDMTDFARVGSGDGEPAGAFLKRITTYVHGAVSRFARMNAPVIAAVNGTAAGGGFSLMLGCDLAIAASHARFTMAYTRGGLTPDGSSTFYLGRLVGPRRAAELTLTNRTLSAEEALDWGILNRVVPADELQDAALEMANAIADGPLAAHGVSKRLLLEGSWESLETQMERESQAIAAAASGPEGTEGINAFVEKRRPNYRDL